VVFIRTYEDYTTYRFYLLTNNTRGLTLNCLYFTIRTERVLLVKKLLLFPVILLIILLIAAGFSCQSSVETATESTATTETSEQPVRGGTFRIITALEPTMLGYPPLMSPEDESRAIPGLEKLMDWNPDRDQDDGLMPVLAESAAVDITNSRIVFHLRSGVKFQDGSPMNADAVIWNFKLLKEAGALQYANNWKGIEKTDDLTVEIDYTEYNNQLIRNWGMIKVISREAWAAASGGDLQKGIDWAQTHVVGIGPFMLQEFKRGNHMVWVKNPDYWREGKPYLDGIEVRFIPDSMTARAIMLAGQADYWEFSYSLELEEQGFDVWKSWHGIISCIWPNTASPDSKWRDIRLRKALEYAIDKQTLTEMFGAKTFIPMKMIAPEGEWGYDPGYAARGYDPEKARQLVIEAGYPDGLDVELLISTAIGAQPFGVMLKQYLDDVGIRTTIDMADPGRAAAAMYGGNPGPDLMLSYYGMDVNFLATYMNWFSTSTPFKISYLGHTDEQRALDEQAMIVRDTAGQQSATGDLVKYVEDNAIVIPIMWFGMRQIVAPYVHGPNQIGPTWHTEDLWMEEH
jgi:peptide/nickel transport system substrate-binding protein